MSKLQLQELNLLSLGYVPREETVYPNCYARLSPMFDGMVTLRTKPSCSTH